MAKLFDSIKQTIRKLSQPARDDGPSRESETSVGRSTEREAEQAPPERVGEVVGHSSGG